MKKQLFFILCFFAAAGSQAQVFFSQNFDGKTLANIASPAPNSTQFNVASTFEGTNDPADDAGTIAITADKVVLGKTENGQATGTAFLTRSTALAPATQFIVAQFDIDFTTAVASTSAFQFLLGSGFSADHVVETGTTILASRVNFNAVATNSFRTRANAGTNGAADYAGNQTIRIFMNQTAESREYVGPDAATYILATKTYNVWVGNVKQHATNIAVTNPAVTVNAFKILLTGGPMTVKIDNITLTSLEGTLPVALSSFTGKLNGNASELKWTTQSEQSNSHFDILRSSDGKVFSKVGSVSGDGTSSSVNNYTFRDVAPASGINYYQLQQTDFNGVEKIIGQLSVSTNISTEDIALYLDGANDLNANVNAVAASKANIRVVDLTGRVVINQDFSLSAGSNNVKLSTAGLTKGIYVATVVIDGEAKSIKILL